MTRDIIETAHEIPRKLLEENRPRLVHLAERLLSKEVSWKGRNWRLYSPNHSP